MVAEGLGEHGPVAGIPFIGEPFFADDLSLSARDILAVAVGVPVAAAVAALLALRRVRISPLGVARRVTQKPPRAWRMVPLLAGLAELGFWTVHGHPASDGGQVQAFVSSFALIVVGLFIAGPWFTMAAARVRRRVRTSNGRSDSSTVLPSMTGSGAAPGSGRSSRSVAVAVTRGKSAASRVLARPPRDS